MQISPLPCEFGSLAVTTGDTVLLCIVPINTLWLLGMKPAFD